MLIILGRTILIFNNSIQYIIDGIKQKGKKIFKCQSCKQRLIFTIVGALILVIGLYLDNKNIIGSFIDSIIGENESSLSKDRDERENIEGYQDMSLSKSLNEIENQLKVMENTGKVKEETFDMRKASQNISQYIINKTARDESDREFMSNMMDRHIKRHISPSVRSDPVLYRYSDGEQAEDSSFSATEKVQIDRILNDEKGWKSMGWNFERVDGGNPFLLNGIGGGGNNKEREVDVVLHLKSREEMKKIFPQAHLQGLSITDMGSRPMNIYFDAQNWNYPPSEFEGTKEQYRQYLVQHEMGHVIGYDHQHPDGSRGEVVHGIDGTLKKDIKKVPDQNCPVMYQQSRGTRGWCRVNPWVSLENKK